MLDPIRRIWIKSSPEELVRQCIIQYLTHEKKYSPRLISVEREIKFYHLSKRYDIVVFTADAVPLILIECKAPKYDLTIKVNEQIAIYQQILQGQYVWISNGHQNQVYQFDKNEHTYRVLEDVPSSKR